MANNNSGRDKNEKDLVCSFCGKHQDEVERMIIGPGVNICSECIEPVRHDLLSDKPDAAQAVAAAPAAQRADRGTASQPADDAERFQHPDPGRRSRKVWISTSSVRTSAKRGAGRLGLQPL